jgi:hypothetical protein
MSQKVKVKVQRLREFSAIADKIGLGFWAFSYLLN